MRNIFTLCLTVVVGGLAYFVAVVLMHRAGPESDQDQRMGAPAEPD